MSMSGIVTVGRRPYAVGLYWENSPSGRISQAAREAAHQPGADAIYFAARAGNKAGRVPQFGLSQNAEQHHAGMAALAACIANQQPGSWAGAFRMREGVALVIVRDDLIVPDGDQFFLDETEARDRLIQEMTFGGLQRIYAPESWGISGADSMPLSLLLNDRADVHLRHVAIPKSVRMALMGVVGLVVLGLAIGWYIQDQNEKETAQRMANMQALERAKREAARTSLNTIQRPEYPPPDRKWEKEPKPIEFLDACQQALSSLPLAIVGWKMETITCAGSSIAQTWRRTSGFALPPADAAITDNGSAVTISQPMQKLSGRGPEELTDIATVTNRYLSQNWEGTISRIPDDPPPPPPPGYTGQWNPPPTPWVKRSFTLSARVLPSTLPVYFDGLPGVIISKASVNTGSAGSAWKIEGVIYEKRR